MPDNNHHHATSMVNQDKTGPLTNSYGRTSTFNRDTAFGER